MSAKIEMSMNDVAIVDPDSPRAPGWLRLVLVSDTHNVDIPASLFPPGDLLIHAGDHTTSGLSSELASAADWLRSLAARFTHGAVVIAGNHDKPLDEATWLQAAPYSHPAEPWTAESMAQARRLFNDSGLDVGGQGGKPVRLLQHAASEIGALKVFGSPYAGLTPRRRAMEQGDPRRCEGFLRDEPRLAELYDDIPCGLDVLITHSPPLGILDASVQYGGVLRDTPIAIGSSALHDRLRAMRPADRPRLHVFGHEHDARGVLCDHEMRTVFVNAAAVNGDRGVIAQGGGYLMKEGFRPIVVDIRERRSLFRTPDESAADATQERHAMSHDTESLFVEESALFDAGLSPIGATSCALRVGAAVADKNKAQRQAPSLCVG